MKAKLARFLRRKPYEREELEEPEPRTTDHCSGLAFFEDDVDIRRSARHLWHKKKSRPQRLEQGVYLCLHKALRANLSPPFRKGGRAMKKKVLFVLLAGFAIVCLTPYAHGPVRIKTNTR